MMFRNDDEAHQHSLETLSMLQEYDEFMESIGTLVDLGCGSGLDVEWWATRTTREYNPKPLNIACVGIDIIDQSFAPRQHKNVSYQQIDFEKTITLPQNKQFDVLWCHNAFQYAIDPVGTLSRWHEIANPGAMLVLIVPETQRIHHKKLIFTQPTGCFYHYSIVNLMHMLAVSGWDCRTGFFKKNPTDPWIHAIVYKSEHKPMDPKTATWYQLSEMGLLPESADVSIRAHGELQQQELVVPWLDHSLCWLGNY
jgi:SAM-dependent methyltransferase